MKKATSDARTRALRRCRSKRPTAGDRAVQCLVVAGILFVLLTAVNLLFPGTVKGVALTAKQALSRDADYRSAFAAVGRAIGGTEAVSDSLQDAYVAVFHPQDLEDDEEEPEQTAAEPESDETTTLNTLSVSVVTLEEEPDVSVEEDAAEASSYVSLPDNASLEQRNLGFEYDSPVLGTLSSTFGWREHPIEGGTKFHYGVDLAADTGTAITAFADGTVYATGESSTLGKYIMLRHEGGYMTIYGHCSQITVTSGDVSMGEKIAEVGETGAATGPHLHFELHDGSLYLNPIYYVAVG